MRPFLMGLVTLLGISHTADAGLIRTVHMNSEKMKTVNLKMGQSTVIRFSEKPKKVVIGNQNYFSIEFIENDVTIQPLGQMKTNLFVYTAHHVYGFIINPKLGGSYDDIVNVRWLASGIILKPPVRVKHFIKKTVSKEITFKKIKVKITALLINKKRGTHIIEFSVQNNSLAVLKEKDFEFYLTRSKKRLEVQEFALKQPVIPPYKTVKGRLLVKLSKKKGFTFNLKFKKQIKGKIISRRFL